MTSTPSAPTVNYNPQSGTGQVYTPQNQPSADYNYTSLLNNLMSQYTTSGTPGQQQYPLASGLARTYANEANAPTWEDYINRVNYNPYYNTAQDASVTAAGYGSSMGQTQADVYNQVLAALPSLISDYAKSSTAGTSSINNLAALTSTYASPAQNAAASTLSLGPQMQNLIASITGNVAPVQSMADEVNAYNQEFKALGNQAAGLVQPISDLAKGVAGTVPAVDTLAGNVAGTVPTVNALAGNVAGLMPKVGDLAAGVAGTIPSVTGLAGRVAGTLPQYQAAADRTLGYLPEIQRQQDYLTNLEAQPTGAGSLRDAASKLLTTGFDPQNALFNQLTQQTRDQANAINAASGLAGSPYASGLTSDALRNLDIQWQNQQLGRQESATAGAGSALAQASGLTQDQARLAQDVQNAISMKTGLSTQALADLTAMGGQAGTAGGLYGTAGGLAGTAGGLYGTEAGIGGTAGGLYGVGGNLANTAANIYGTGANISNVAGGLYDTAGNAITRQANLYGQGVSAESTAANLRNLAANIAATAGGQTSALANINTAGTNQLLGAGSLNTAASNMYDTASAEAARAASIAGLAPSAALTNQNLISNLANTVNATGAMPSNTYLQNIQSQMAARNAQLNALSGATGQAATAADVGNTQYSMVQNVLNDLLNYLITGQNATKTGVSSGLAGTSQNTASLAGLAGLGTLGSNALFGSGGLTGALGGNSQTGLLGALTGLFGGGGSAAGSAPFITTGGDYAALSSALFGV